MKVEGYWKVLAIVFISLFVVETIIFGFLWGMGTSWVMGEEKCASLCVYDKGYDAYYYDYYIEMCYCYVGSKIVETIDMG